MEERVAFEYDVAEATVDLHYRGVTRVEIFRVVGRVSDKFRSKKDANVKNHDNKAKVSQTDVALIRDLGITQGTCLRYRPSAPKTRNNAVVAVAALLQNASTYQRTKSIGSFTVLTALIGVNTNIRILDEPGPCGGIPFNRFGPVRGDSSNVHLSKPQRS